MSLEKQILDRIRIQGVRPTSKRYFQARDYLLWALLGASLAALSLGLGMVIFMVKGADFLLFTKLGLSTSEKVVYSIPFFWIIASAIIGGLALINFKSTKKGYKTSSRQFILIAVMIALALGSVIYALNLTTYVDKAASHAIPRYNSIVPYNTNTWLDPSRGLLSGIVKEKTSNSDFTIRDVNSVLWHVTGTGISIPPDYDFHTGDRIKLIGQDRGNETFEATEIIPWSE